MLTTFWDLCSDIILEISGYFSIDELYLSFYPDVLPYLFKLLVESRIHLHLCLTDDNLLNHTLLCLINTNQVISLRTTSSRIPLNAFNAVKTLTFNNVPKINNMSSKLSILPSLEHLIFIYSSDHIHQANNALKLAFSRPSLKYLKLHLSNDYPLIPSSSLQRSFSIEQFIVNASCSPFTLDFLLNCLPCLRILQIRTLMDLQSTTVRNAHGGASQFPRINHPTLQILDLVWYRPILADITILLTGLPNLKQCRLSGVMNSTELNGKLWYNLIIVTCSNLLKMNTNILIWTGIETEEIKTNFDQDMFFKRIDFQLESSEKEKELLILTGDFKRTI